MLSLLKYILFSDLQPAVVQYDGGNTLGCKLARRGLHGFSISLLPQVILIAWYPPITQLSVLPCWPSNQARRSSRSPPMVAGAELCGGRGVRSAGRSVSDAGGRCGDVAERCQQASSCSYGLGILSGGQLDCQPHANQPQSHTNILHWFLT